MSLLVAKKREGGAEGPGGWGGSSNNGRAQPPGTGIKRITIQGLQQVNSVGSSEFRAFSLRYHMESQIY